MENQEIFITIFVGVKYAEKDVAKSKGAKWDMEGKKWYFKYKLDHFFADDSLHTFEFKPFSINISYQYAKQYGEVKRIQEINRCYEIAKDRNIKYIESKEKEEI